MLIRKISEGFSEKDAMNTENRTEQASIGTTGDMKDSVAVAGNDNAVNSVEGNKIIGDHNKITIVNPPIKEKTPPPEKTSFLIPNYIIVLALIGLSVWWFMQSTTLKPFEGNTYGIIVTAFKGNTEEQKNKGKEIQSAIQSTLNTRFKELGINDAEARKDKTSIESHEAAREFGKKYKAELVIWGDVTLQGIIPNITIVNQKSEISKIMKPETSILKDSLCHAALAQVNDIRFPALTDEPTKLVSFVTAIKYSNNEDYKKAIEYYNFSLPEEPMKYIDSSFILLKKGLIIGYYMKQHREGIEIFNQIIEINPKFDNAYVGRGLIYAKKGDYDKAIADYTQAIQMNKKNDMAYNNRGSAYADKGDYDKAIADHTQAIQVNRKNHMAYSNRGFVYEKISEYGKAIDDYTYAIQINLKDYWSYNQIAWLLATCPDKKYRNGEKAIEFSKKATELEPKNSGFWDTHAAAYAEAGKFEEAVKTQEKAIEMLTEKERKEELSEYTEHLNSYKANKPWREKHKSGIGESSLRP